MAATTTRTDAEFIDEIIELIDGTHWTRGSLDTFCWVPVRVVQAPEGEEIRDRYVKFADEDEDWADEDVPFVSAQFNIWKDNREPQACWRKDQYCLMGMVLKVAKLYMDETAIRRHDQALRVTELLWDQLPKNHQQDPDKYSYLGEDTRRFREISTKVHDIEGWNDCDDRTKAEVRELCVAARDAAREAESGTAQN
jgi:hypothetical protein